MFKTAKQLRTKTHNYLLRSKYSRSVIDVAAMALVGSVVVRNGAWIITDDQGEWAGNCGGDVRELLKRGLATTCDGGPSTFLLLTTDGIDALHGACAKLDINAAELRADFYARSAKAQICYVA